jgi:hypothetical protein
MKIKFSLLLVFLGLCLTLAAQNSNHHFGLHDSSPDSLSGLTVNASTVISDGGMLVLTGNEYRPAISTTTYGFSLVRFDVNGVKQWNTFIYGDGSGQLSYRQIVEMTDGGFVIVVNNYFGGAGAIIKTDAAGNFLFMKEYFTGILNAQLDSSDNGLILTTNSGNTYSGIIKTDATGNILWSDTREFVADPDHYYAAKRLSNGNYLAVGVAYSNPSITMGGGIVACYSPSGTLLWSKAYYVSSEWITEFLNFTELSDGNIMIAGGTSSLTVNGTWPLLTKIDQNGNVLWSKSYGSGTNEFYATYSFSDDFTYIGGCIWGNSVGFIPVVSKLDSSGNMLWARVFPQSNPNNSFGPFINFGSGTYSSVGAPTVNGNHYVMYNYSDFCSSDTSLTQSCYLSDTSLVRTDVAMTAIVTSPAVANPYNAPVNDTLTNSSLVNFSKYDVCIPAGVASVILSTASVSVFPNPLVASGILSIQETGRNGKAVVLIYNIIGEEISKTGTEMINGNAKVELDADKFVPGTFLYTVIFSDGSRATGKFVVE